MASLKYEDLDNEDPLRSLQSEFLYPQHEGKKTVYLCGNSLGLQSKGIQERITEQLTKWTNQGVEGHFTGMFSMRLSSLSLFSFVKHIFAIMIHSLFYFLFLDRTHSLADDGEYREGINGKDRRS